MVLYVENFKRARNDVHPVSVVILRCMMRGHGDGHVNYANDVVGGGDSHVDVRRARAIVMPGDGVKPPFPLK